MRTRDGSRDRNDGEGENRVNFSRAGISVYTDNSFVFV